MIQPPLPPEAIPEEARVVRALLKAARSRGLLCSGAPGVGKSRTFGNLALLDFIDDDPIGQAVIDPVGGTIDNFFVGNSRYPQLFTGIRTQYSV